VEMEERINRLEAVIVASGLDNQMRGDSPSVSNDAHPPVANVADRLSTLLIDDEGSSIFLGSSSGFSLFSLLKAFSGLPTGLEPPSYHALSKL